MTCRPLVIGKAEQEAIASVIDYAFRNSLTMEYMKKAAGVATHLGRGDKVNLGRGGMSIGDDPERWVIIPFGYRVAFSIEEQPEPLGWCRHISISVLPTRPGVYANEHAVGLLMKEFGFRGSLRSPTMLAYMEEEFLAINVIESITQEEHARL